MLKSVAESEMSAWRPLPTSPHLISASIVFLIFLVQISSSATVPEEKFRAPIKEVAKLLKPMLGLEHMPVINDQSWDKPPVHRYMMDLYKSVADLKTGLTLTTNPYNAKTVTSLSLVNVKTFSKRKHLMFDLSTLNLTTPLIEAELRIYKSKARLRKRKVRGAKSHLLEIHVYQAEKFNDSNIRGKLLDARRVSSHSTGWEVFFVKSAVVEWLRKPQRNYGLFVTLRNMFGEELETKGILRIRGRHMQRSEPTLILYNGDSKHNNPSDSGQYGSRQRSRLKRYKDGQEYSRKKQHRKKRRRNKMKKKKVHKRSTDLISGQCKRHKLVVDFERIGWANWIISPKSYNAYYCKGSCPFPLGQNLKPTNHATVQSIVRGLGLTNGVTEPCCVPNKLYSISLLYYDDHGNVVLKQYDDMVAGSCGCH